MGAQFNVPAPTLLDHRVSTSTLTNYASASISPVFNCLLVVVFNTSADKTASLSMSTTLSNIGAWTIYSLYSGNSTLGTVMIAVAQATGPPGTGTVTVSWTNATARQHLQVYSFPPGFNTTTPVAQRKDGTASTAATTTYSLTMTSTPAATSRVIGAIIENTTPTNLTAGTGYTEGSEDISGAIDLESEYSGNSHNSTVDWGGGIVSARRIGIAIEIAAFDYKPQGLELAL